MSNIKLKRGEWLSDTFTFLWLQGTVLRDAPLWAIGSPEALWAERSAYQKTLCHLASQRWDRVLRKRVFWQDFDQVFRWSVNQAEQAEVKLHRGWFYTNLRSASRGSYWKPYRPSFWNLRDYREETTLRLKSGSYVRADRQHGGPVSYILKMPGLTAWSHDCDIRLSLYALDRQKTAEEQWLLERIGRLSREDCWSPRIVGVPFDQSPSAYLYPEHAPERVRYDDVVTVQPARWNYQRLLADQPAHNAQWGSYWNRTGIGRLLGRSLNIDRETIAMRDNMIVNMQHDFGQDQQKVVA